MSGGVPEYLNWSDFFKIFSHNKTPKKVKIILIDTLPLEFVLSLEEIGLNLKNYNIPLSADKEQEILSQFKSVLSFLADKKVSVKEKRERLKKPKGLLFLEKGLPIILAELEQTNYENEQAAINVRIASQ